MMSVLPEKIFFYVPSKATIKDPYVRFVYCSVDYNTASYKLTPVVADSSSPLPSFLISLPSDIQGFVFQGIEYSFRPFRTHANTIVNKHILGCHDIVIRNAMTNEIVPVFSFASPATVFGPVKLHRNVTILPFSSPPSSSPPSSSPSSLPPSSSSSSSSPPPTITIPPVPKKKKSALAPNTTKKEGDLQPFVAKQLLQLAQSRKELCPITAEEYITGHTAVLPCGHLFMDMAIEETFKKEPNKCPACRQSGRPTFV